jgi:hypothetical protein
MKLPFLKTNKVEDEIIKPSKKITLIYYISSNQLNQIKVTINSIIKQSYHNWEIFVTNNENSIQKEIIDYLSLLNKQFKNINYISATDNVSETSFKEAIISQSTGYYIASLGSGQIWNIDALNIISESFDDNIDFVYGNHIENDKVINVKDNWYQIKAIIWKRSITNHINHLDMCPVKSLISTKPKKYIYKSDSLISYLNQQSIDLTKKTIWDNRKLLQNISDNIFNNVFNKKCILVFIDVDNSIRDWIDYKMILVRIMDQYNIIAVVNNISQESKKFLSFSCDLIITIDQYITYQNVYRNSESHLTIFYDSPYQERYFSDMCHQKIITDNIRNMSDHSKIVLE